MLKFYIFLISLHFQNKELFLMLYNELNYLNLYILNFFKLCTINSLIQYKNIHYVTFLKK